MNNRTEFRSRYGYRIALGGIVAISVPVVVAAIYIVVFDPRPEFFAALAIYVATTGLWSFPWSIPLRSKLIADTGGVTVIDGSHRQYFLWEEIAGFSLDSTQMRRFESDRAELELVSGVRIRISAIESPPTNKTARFEDARLMIEELNQRLHNAKLAM